MTLIISYIAGMQLHVGTSFLSFFAGERGNKMACVYMKIIESLVQSQI